ncbi:MAG: winged helix-turn-helix domain-containing protein [Desulfurococcales archaeon]|jgi:DNA-binding transcriptional ArsR family regulator|nr:winged helix-turn-helix domain-containing protein [Desulfurococcales archaeon]
MAGRLDIENLLGSRARIRILRYLLEVGEANITRISREARVSQAIARRYLEDLARIGLVEEVKLGRMRIYRVVWSDTRIRILKTLINMG